MNYDYKKRRMFECDCTLQCECVEYEYFLLCRNMIPLRQSEHDIVKVSQTNVWRNMMVIVPTSPTHKIINHNHK